MVFSVKRCSIPEEHDIENGANENHYSNVYGTEIKYSCNDGFMFSGPKSRVCQADGKWSELPKCVGRYHFSSGLHQTLFQSLNGHDTASYTFHLQ